MREWVGKKCKVFIRNLFSKPIVYTGVVLSVDKNFMTMIDRDNNTISINIQDIIQVRGEE